MLFQQQVSNLYSERKITSYSSPLEQFESSTIGAHNYKPVTTEVYFQWALNFDYSNMSLYSPEIFFDFEGYSSYSSLVSYILTLSIFFIIIGVIIYGKHGESIVTYFNNYFLSSWVATKVFLYLTTITNISYQYLSTNVPLGANSNVLDVRPFVVPINHGGFLITDSFCFFITAILFLYLCTGFQDFHSSKGPFIISKNPLTYVQISIHKVTVELLGSSIDRNVHTQSYHAFVYGLFTYLTISNLQGLVPFTLTVTSHLIATFFLAQVVIMYVTSTILAEQGFNYLLSLFMPSGAPLLLGYLLIPIEFISFFFKTVSLSVRLFANMMAGHTLLKVILGFAWTLLTVSEVYFIVNLFPIVILILLTVLEIGVSVIQAYIFSILTCLYLRDAFQGH